MKTPDPMTAPTVAEVLERAADLISRGWCRVQPTEREHTLASALWAASKGWVFPAMRSLGFSSLYDLFDWNDDPKRSRADVLELILQARSAKAEG